MRMNHVLFAMTVSIVGEIATERPAAALPTGCGQCTVGQYCVHDTRWTWQPGYVPGAQRGDLVFYARQQSVVQAMLAAIPESNTHIGIMSNGSSARHSIQWEEPQRRKSLSNPFDLLWRRIKDGNVSTYMGLATFDSAQLFAGLPGFTTSNVADDPHWKPTDDQPPFAINLSRPPGLATTVGSARWRFTQLASKMESLSGRYGIYSYTDYPFVTRNRGLTGCSGAVTWAAELLGSSVISPPNLTFYTSAVRAASSQALYSFLFDKIRAQVPNSHQGCACLLGGYCGPGPDNQNCTNNCNVGAITCIEGKHVMSSTQMDLVAEGLANQIVNCFAFGDSYNSPPGDARCSDSSRRWRDGVDSGIAIGPDKVVNWSTQTYGASVTAVTPRGGSWVQENYNFHCSQCGNSICEGQESSSCPSDCAGSPL